jgi:GxxExxY protein
MDHDYQITGEIIGCAIEVHKALGPGLKEKVYEEALCGALRRKNIGFTNELAFPITVEGVKVGTYRPDLIVENSVVVEVKSCERMSPLFTSQLVTYLRITKLRVGLILNFNCSKMSQGIKRVVL